jgi:hypothetical protein
MGVPMSDDFMPDSVIDDHINLALQAIDAEQHWPWSDVGQAVTLTSDAPDIIPTADWRATRSVHFGEYELNLVAPADLLRAFDFTADVPLFWCPMNDVIAVRPKVNNPTEVTHYFYRQGAWLANDADAPTIPAQYTGAIVAKASELLSMRESAGGDVTRHGAEFTAWISRMKRDMRRSTPGTRVRVRPGSWI